MAVEEGDIYNMMWGSDGPDPRRFEDVDSSEQQRPGAFIGGPPIMSEEQAINMFLHPEATDAAVAELIQECAREAGLEP